MNKKDWKAVQQAKNILCLGENATLAEIKQSYHRLCKKYHPDRNAANQAAASRKMYRLTEAYERLLQFCNEYRFPLEPPAHDKFDCCDPQEWWMTRFGEDPFWGTKTKNNKK